MDTLTVQERIEYIWENKDATQNIVDDLTNVSILHKCTEAVDFLSALAVFPGGHDLALECLSTWQRHLGRRYRFEPLVEQLEINESRHRCSLLTLVNCLLTACPTTQSRRRLRNELVGVKFMSVVERIKSESTGVERVILSKELDRFEQMKVLEDEQLAGPDGVDLNSHQDIFYAILKQVSHTPHEVLFLNLLQHLLQVDSKLPISDCVWTAAEKLIGRVRLIESAEEADKLIRIHTTSYPMLDKLRVEGRCHCSCHRQSPNQNGESTPPVVTPMAPPPPPAPPLPNLTSTPPAAPPLPPMINGPSPSTPKNLPFAELLSLKSRSLQKQTDDDETPSSPPPRFETKPKGSYTPTMVEQADEFDPLPQQLVPVPKAKLKTLAWNKVPISKVMTQKDNLWLRTASRIGNNGVSLDFERLDELFCQSSPPGTLERKGSVATTPDQAPLKFDKKRKESQQAVNLLAPKRSLNVNIFLKQFRGDVNNLLELIDKSDGSEIGLEKLRSLQKILPELDEIESLRAYTGDIQRLGGAEQFFLKLIQLADYKFRIDCMLLREEFGSAVDYIKPALDAIILAAQDLKNCRLLQEVLYLVLMVGNYLNAGSYGGNAAGFKMTSLWKLVEIKANRSNMTLLHFVVMEAEAKHPQLLEFPKQVKFLEDASKLSLDSIRGDVRSLREKTERISNQISGQEEKDFIVETKQFLELAQRELSIMSQDLEEIERLRLELADFFCEDKQSFKLEECFKIFHSFCLQFTKAVNENNTRKINETKAEQRRQQHEQELKRRKEDTELELTLNRKYSALDDSSDITLTTYRSGSQDNSSLLKCRKESSTSLVEILEHDNDSSEIVENAAKSAFQRRSVRRRSAAWISVNDRERQANNGVIMREKTPLLRGTRTRLSLDLSADKAPPIGNIDKQQDLSPLIIRTRLIDKDRGRILSAGDLRSLAEKPEPSEDGRKEKVENIDENSVVADKNLERWRAERDRRTQSMVVDTVQSAVKGVEDLTGLLETLEAEKRHHEIVTRGRKYRWRETNGSGTETKQDSSSDREKSLTEPERITSWREKIKQEIPDYDKYSNKKGNENIASEKEKTDIDAVVRHCEKTRDEIDNIVPSGWNGKSVRDSGIEESTCRLEQTEIHSSAVSPESNQQLALDIVSINNRTSGQSPISKTESSSDGEQWKSVTDTDSPVLSSPSSSLNSGSGAEKDEGFETESHSTVCSAVPDPTPEPQLHSTEPQTVGNSRRLPNYLTGTKASSTRKSDAKAPLRPSSNQTRPVVQERKIASKSTPRNGQNTPPTHNSNVINTSTNRTKSGSPSNTNSNSNKKTPSTIKKCPRVSPTEPSPPQGTCGLQTSDSNSSVRSKVTVKSAGGNSHSGSASSVRGTNRPQNPPKTQTVKKRAPEKPVPQKTNTSVNTVIRGQIAKMRLRISDPRPSSTTSDVVKNTVSKRPSAPLPSRTPTSSLSRSPSTDSTASSSKRWERLWSPPKSTRTSTSFTGGKGSAFTSVQSTGAKSSRPWR